MKKRIKKISILLFVSLLSTIILFTSCSKVIPTVKLDSMISAPVMTGPENERTYIRHKIDWDTMKGAEIATKAYDNMLYVPYVWQRQVGLVSTKTAGMTVEQTVSSKKMIKRKPAKPNRAGVMEAEPIVAYFDSYAITSRGIAGVDIRLMSETLLRPDGKYFYREAGGKDTIRYDTSTGRFYNVTGSWSQKRNNNLELHNKNANKDNPNGVLPYVINEDTIKFAKAPKLASDDKDEYKGKYYTVFIDLKKEAYQNYLEIMKDMLAAGGTNGEIKYNSLTMDIQIWKEGVIKQLRFIESYDLVIGPLNSKATLTTDVEFNYEKQAVEKELYEYVKSTNKVFSNSRRVSSKVDQSKLT